MLILKGETKAQVKPKNRKFLIFESKINSFMHGKYALSGRPTQWLNAAV